jgi:hypothetical protein
MKTKLTILALMLFSGCEKETPVPTCQCREATFIQGNQGYWTEQSSTAPQTMNCTSDGDIIQTWTVVEPAWTVNYKKQIVCE